MSADEIKALAQQAFVDGMASHRAGLLDMEVRCKQYYAALFDFATMVERCEELKAQCVKICGKNECDNKGSKCIQCAYPVIDFIAKGEK